MNVFYLDPDPVKCAKMHVDKHVVKMIVEYAQLLSTAHRMLDAVEYTGLSKNEAKSKDIVSKMTTTTKLFIKQFIIITHQQYGLEHQE